MNKCLKITFLAQYPEGFLQTFIQGYAREYGLEGMAQVVSSEGKVVVVVCGPKDKVDLYIDLFDSKSEEVKLQNITIEPFLKAKDYRGVFRIIE